MTSIQSAASDFLAAKRIAVTGVSRSPQSHGSNVVYRYLRDRGHEVFAVNPNAPSWASTGSGCIAGPAGGASPRQPRRSAGSTGSR
jgi:predicted CoA-binding protein